ncbi:MAG: glycosyltransferase [Candidatus Dojkabacteria bacterium]|nr:glycosyltransferase [Candidatus Dojkabacteria bacterium]
MPQSKFKIAIVIEPIIKFEKWFEYVKYILKLFPNSDIYTAYYNTDITEKYFKDRKINDTFLQLIAPEDNRKGKWLKLERLAYKSLHLKNYDAVISISSRCAKYVNTGKDVKHITMIMKPHKLFENKKLDKKDRKFTEKLENIVVNSFSEKRKLKRIYKVNSTVLYPPVDIKKYNPEKALNRKENWFLTDSTLSNRSLRLVIKAIIESGEHLKILGKTENSEELIKEFKARGQVKFVGDIPESGNISLMQNCKAYIYPTKNNNWNSCFIKANASGTAVIAYKRGIVSELLSLEYPKTGICFDKYNYKSLVKTIKSFNDNEFDSRNCIIKAQEFDSSIFMYKLKTYVEDIVQSN